MASEPVILNVYDLSWINGCISSLGFGVFHSGVEVYGREYTYGAHQFPISGVFEIDPRHADDLGEHFRFKESILLGHTTFSPNDVHRITKLLGKKFRGDQYHVLHKNCNHFTSALVQVLCGESLPSWVNRLAYVGSYIPFVDRAITKLWLSLRPLETITESNSTSETTETSVYKSKK